MDIHTKRFCMNLKIIIIMQYDVDSGMMQYELEDSFSIHTI